MKPYNHAANLTNPAVAAAVAKIANECVTAKSAYRVEFIDSDGEARYADLGRYDAIGLAKDLHYAGRQVTLTHPSGRKVDIANTTY